MTLEEYISVHSTPENEVLESIVRDTHIHILNPHMLSGHVQGRVLSMISHMIRPNRILELGTFTGYSALCLAEGLSEDGELVTIEHNDELETTIRRNLAKSPLSSKIRLIIGDAKEILQRKSLSANPTHHRRCERISVRRSRSLRPRLHRCGQTRVLRISGLGLSVDSCRWVHLGGQHPLGRTHHRPCVRQGQTDPWTTGVQRPFGG